MSRRDPDRYRAGDERPWWEDAPGDSVFDRPTAAGPGAGRRPGPAADHDIPARAARDLWSHGPTRADNWARDDRTAPSRDPWSDAPTRADRGVGRATPYRDPWPADPGPGGWAPDSPTVPASPAYQPSRYPPPAGGPAPTAAAPRTAVWPAPPYADQPGTAPEADPWRGRPARPRRDDGPGGGSGSRRRRRDRPDRDRGGRGGFPFGFGALFGLAGLGCFLVALLVLPWFEVGDQGIGLHDMADSFTLAETDPGALVPGAGEGSGDGSAGIPGGLPSPDELADAAEQGARDAAGEAAANALDSGRARYLDLYTDTLWMGVAGATAAAVLLSTVLAPRSAALSLLLGFRALAGLATVAAAGAHGVALWVVFSGEGAPDPAWGVWLGVGGLAGVLLGCIIGPKR